MQCQQIIKDDLNLHSVFYQQQCPTGCALLDIRKGCVTAFQQGLPSKKNYFLYL